MDGHDHWVSDGVNTAHRYPALCGQLVIPAALVAPPGPTCPGCTAALDERHQRRRGLGVLTRLASLTAVRQGKHRRDHLLRSGRLVGSRVPDEL